ncbi:POK18 protein, partial [Neopipo cinnamomea]|nr:POK18 protein [Neopipo cinnamomea]
WNYLGLRITETRITPQKLEIKMNIRTVHDVQKLLGDIQWLRAYCGITNSDLQPLFDLLKGSKTPADP